jgi:eukaryotic-like serine/threonine-protein kinase
MGTPNYIAPELLQGRKVDKRCDIFSLGVVIYEMLLNKRPFRGDNLTSLIYSIVNSEPELPSKVDRSIPLLFDRVVEKALRKNPDERYQNASEIARSLADFLETFSPKSSVSL